eukprot:CAMPEP_0184859918 /NCGR_PEP_ID=MMETSP0580-20130426/4880_1 /TAXON_ID=1118495 /ORGANISM="Dactyliosolen fragilissimus" /LENGTH=281 /DNA_ID=CAMNT_0027356801 /DNA_START=94 /DNA_END=939 /DNA_ORIENTATION=-
MHLTSGDRSQLLERELVELKTEKAQLQGHNQEQFFQNQKDNDDIESLQQRVKDKRKETRAIENRINEMTSSRNKLMEYLESLKKEYDEVMSECNLAKETNITAQSELFVVSEERDEIRNKSKDLAAKIKELKLSCVKLAKDRASSRANNKMLQEVVDKLRSDIEDNTIERIEIRTSLEEIRAETKALHDDTDLVENKNRKLRERKLMLEDPDEYKLQKSLTSLNDESDITRNIRLLLSGKLFKRNETDITHSSHTEDSTIDIESPINEVRMDSSDHCFDLG